MMKYFIYLVVILTVYSSLSLAFEVVSPGDVTFRSSTRITPGSGGSARVIPAVLALLLKDVPPVIESISIIATPGPEPTYNSTLSCAAIASDNEGDIITIHYEWLVNSVSIATGVDSISDLTTEDFDIGDTVRCEATPHANGNIGSTAFDSVTIVETPLIVTCPSDFDTIVLSTQTLTGLVTGTFYSSYWSVVSTPIGASEHTLKVTTNTSAELFTDVVGSYVLDFLVSGDTEQASCQTTVNAYTNDFLVAELSWTTGDPPVTDTSDVDLFLHRAATGSYFYWDSEPFTESPDNCYWNNCATCTVPYSNPDREELCRSALASSSPPPVLIWNGGDPDANPRLDLDDIEGQGPEVTNIALPDPGTYRLAVHYYDKDTSTLPLSAQVRIICGGQLLYQSEPVVLETHGSASDHLSNDLWEVGDITIYYIGEIPNCSFTEFGGTGCHRICPMNEGQPGGCVPASCE